ncbi:hypothetical protein HBI56_224750 [Parastagonospora nodorum]|nr:hypothetical protein HBI10_192880 [Parastagonospora nodorum]KAH4008594.1 hypothetical protein HBI13_233020 [Parastagonospora nodorum]KAH4013403.1 hypothetical protein HBI09_217770 [Parastagonospora nodorum]KAH4045190.1 hypothetical protein HBH49_206830 [Parastagonospora nodorum]KAH4335569.1 hypothetical protein HBH98_232510 [Parastagonospora nodorum]
MEARRANVREQTASRRPSNRGLVVKAAYGTAERDGLLVKVSKAQLVETASTSALVYFPRQRRRVECALEDNDDDDDGDKEGEEGDDGFTLDENLFELHTHRHASTPRAEKLAAGAKHLAKTSALNNDTTRSQYRNISSAWARIQSSSLGMQNDVPFTLRLEETLLRATELTTPWVFPNIGYGLVKTLSVDSNIFHAY